MPKRRSVTAKRPAQKSPPSDRVPTRWDVQLTAAAKADFAEIIAWTEERFGEPQAFAYATMINNAIEILDAGPEVKGARRCDDLLRGAMSLRVSRSANKSRHILFYRVDDKRKRSIAVLRILHDAMDHRRHLRDSK